MNSADNTDYTSICRHYEECFHREGDTHKGVDWPNYNDAILRHRVMSGVFRDQENISVLDIGCGLAHYLDYLKIYESKKNIKYAGLDISEKFIAHCKQKHPEISFIQQDILLNPVNIKVDFCIINGLFTVKRDIPDDIFFSFMKDMIKTSFGLCNKGIAFNVMSKNVDWEREDLFHLSLDEVTAFLCKEISRNFIIRNDYGLYEYTVYIYRNPMGVL